MICLKKFEIFSRNPLNNTFLKSLIDFGTSKCETSQTNQGRNVFYKENQALQNFRTKERIERQKEGKTRLGKSEISINPN